VNGPEPTGYDCDDCQVGDADWSPDGSTLVFAERTAAPDAFPPNTSKLKTWQFGDRTSTLMTQCAEDQCTVESPSWSPDGRDVVYDWWSLSSDASGMTVVSADGSHPRALALPAGVTGSWPSWGRDGRIMFSARVSASDRPIGYRWWVASIRSDGSEYRQIADLGPAYEFQEASAAPDGRTIAVLSRRMPVAGADPGVGSEELWVMDANGSNRRRIWQLTNCCVGAAVIGPEWSPDGRIIALDAPPFSPGAASLFTVDVATGAIGVLWPSYAGMPAWRPVSAP
jgi:Tol biopolymer transport system component